jgi:hypothetical protein
VFDFVCNSKQVLGKLESYYEAAAEVNAEFASTIGSLPDENSFIAYLENFKKRDAIEVTMRAYVEFTYRSQDKTVWQDVYKKFISDSEVDDEVKISVHIRKKYDEYNALSIYCFDEFLRYYNGLSTDKVIKFFVTAFSSRECLRFEVLDKKVDLYTHSIGFCREDDGWPKVNVVRSEWMKKFESASLFLNRIEMPLTPYDFELLGDVKDKDQMAVSFFNKLETMFSFLYLANSSYVVDEKIVLQFSPAQSGFDYEINAIVDNRYICQLFKWAFDGDNAVERAGITRNVICLNCKKAEQILAIDEDVLNSVKSNYVLFQKKTTEQYIEMKNQISAFIIDASKQLQEMVHDLIDGLKNNFVAVIMFLITIILTDSIDWDDFLTTGNLNQDLMFVTKIFITASGVYLIVTIAAMIVKWRFFKVGYNQLKDNYKEVLDERDLENAFKKDIVIKDARRKIIISAIVIGVVWIGFLIAVHYFVNQEGRASAVIP